MLSSRRWRAVPEVHEGLTKDVLSGPPGPEIAAFFDFDGTLIDGYSAAAFLTDRARRGDVSLSEAAKLLRTGLDARAGRVEFDHFMRVGVQAFRGHDAANLARLGERLLRGTLGGLLFPEMLEILAAHRRRGHTIVIASSALPFQVEPVARELGIEHILCTKLESVGDIYTGRVEGPILWGPGKATAVCEFAQGADIDLEQSYAYGNGDEDIDFLRTVGHPRPVNPKAELAAVARREGWPVRRFGSRGRPGLSSVVRTAAAYGGMASAFGAGLGVGLLKQSRRDAVNFTMSVGSDLTLGLAGIHLNVTGEDNLSSQRPAVFIFNHQSILDGFILMKLLREDVAGVAKKEVASQPGFGQFARFANMALVDRGNTGQAKSALQPVVERLQEGYSIAISPEGTRSATPAVGQFKKGAFHMAMQGGVPIVPVVIRNAGELLWRGSKVIRSGAVDVHVHEPIWVGDWTLDTLEERVAEVRALFVATLEDWPTGEE
jgi:putative phosphoserine phosphatase/1-acylglycerol-3-phosphate O-acyltransferase